MNFHFLSRYRIEKFNALQSFWKKERWHPGPTLAWAVEDLPVQLCPPPKLEQVVGWWQTSSFSWSSFFLPCKVHSRRREPSTILFIVQNQSTTTPEQSQTKSYSFARSTIQTTLPTLTRVSTRRHIATSLSKKFSAKRLFHCLAILLRWET